MDCLGIEIVPALVSDELLWHVAAVVLGYVVRIVLVLVSDVVPCHVNPASVWRRTKRLRVVGT